MDSLYKFVLEDGFGGMHLKRKLSYLD